MEKEKLKMKDRKFLQIYHFNNTTCHSKVYEMISFSMVSGDDVVVLVVDLPTHVASSSRFVYSFQMFKNFHCLCILETCKGTSLKLNEIVKKKIKI